MRPPPTTVDFLRFHFWQTLNVFLKFKLLIVFVHSIVHLEDQA